MPVPLCDLPIMIEYFEEEKRKEMRMQKKTAIASTRKTMAPNSSAMKPFFKPAQSVQKKPQESFRSTTKKTFQPRMSMIKPPSLTKISEKKTITKPKITISKPESKNTSSTSRSELMELKNILLEVVEKLNGLETSVSRIEKYITTEMNHKHSHASKQLFTDDLIEGICNLNDSKVKSLDASAKDIAVETECTVKNSEVRVTEEDTGVQTADILIREEFITQLSPNVISDKIEIENKLVENKVKLTVDKTEDITIVNETSLLKTVLRGDTSNFNVISNEETKESTNLAILNLNDNKQPPITCQPKENTDNDSEGITAPDEEETLLKTIFHRNTSNFNVNNDEESKENNNPAILNVNDNKQPPVCRSKTPKNIDKQSDGFATPPEEKFELLVQTPLMDMEKTFRNIWRANFNKPEENVDERNKHSGEYNMNETKTSSDGSSSDVFKKTLSSYKTLQDQNNLCSPKLVHTPGSLMTPSALKSKKMLISRKLQQQLFSLNKE